MLYYTDTTVQTTQNNRFSVIPLQYPLNMQYAGDRKANKQVPFWNIATGIADVKETTQSEPQSTKDDIPC